MPAIAIGVEDTICSTISLIQIESKRKILCITSHKRLEAFNTIYANSEAVKVGGMDRLEVLRIAGVDDSVAKKVDREGSARLFVGFSVLFYHFTFI